MSFLHNYPRLVKLLKWMAPVLLPFSHLCFVLMVLSILLICIPGGLTKHITPVNRVRSWLLRKAHYYWQLSMEGPLFKFIGRCGKMCCRAKLASKCQVPKAFKAKVLSISTLEVAWTPLLPDNPFHEEFYILSYCEVSKKGEAGEWIEKPLRKTDYHKRSQQDGGERPKEIGKAERKRLNLDGLKERTTYRLRVCAAAPKQRSKWSTEVEVTTFAKPTKEMGYHGPLAKGSPTEVKNYTWWQSKHEVGCTIVVPEEWKAKEIKCIMTGDDIRISHENGMILTGKLGKKARVEEVDWILETKEGEEQRTLTITLRKEQLMQLWPCFIDDDDHSKVDTDLVQLIYEGNSLNELSTADLWT